MYFYSGIPAPTSDDEKRAKTFTIGYTDKAGLKTTKTVEAKLPGIDAPTVKDNEDNTLTDGGTLNMLHIDYDPDNVAYTTITLTLPEKDDIEENYEGGAINCELYNTNGNEITIADTETDNPIASSNTNSTTGTITLKIHKEGDYTLKTFTKASGHSNSVTKTYKLKLAYADLDIPVVKKDSNVLSTSINNYIELDPDKDYSTVTISAPTSASFGPPVSGASIEYKLYQGMTETEIPNHKSSEPSTIPINLIDMTLGQWTLVVTATKTGYHSSTATYHIRPYASDLYVKSSNASGNPGSDTEGDGSKAHPYATIERCIQEIQVINKSTAEYTIHIIGTLTGAQTIDGGYLNDNAAKLTIKGESTGILYGNSSAVPLSITTTVPVFITDLKITGGNGDYGGGLYCKADVTLQNGVEISENNATYSGGGIYLKTGSLTIENGVTISGNSATYGGGIYINSNNGCNVTINGGEIKGNNATDGGAIYNLASLMIKGGTISGNSAVTSGGGIYNAETVTMTSGTIGGSGESDLNTITGTSGKGGAVYQNGTFKVSGSAYVYPGTVNSNDVYLPSSKYVTVNAAYSGSSQSATNQMAITPATWKRGTQVLDGSQAANYPTYFKGSEADWTTIKDTNDSNKVKLYTGYTIWVAGTSPATGVGTPKTSANGGRGTKSKPYSSISEAVEQCWTTDKDFIIKLSGTITGTSQTIPDADSTNKTGLAKSITLEGVTGNTSDGIDRNLSSATSGGRALTISTTTPVTIKKIKITKGYTTSSGGGIYVSAGGASLTLGEGALITGNSASGNGGGIYFGGTSGSTANLIMNSTAAISGNSATGTSSQGGGVYLYYANLCMSGNALIGDTSGTSAATSDSTGHSNMAVKGGGVSCGTGANIYLGYASASDTGTTLSDSYGIRHNYASSCGGGVLLSAGSITFKSGSIYANGTAASTDNDGGGIWQNSGTTVTMSGGTIAKNKAYYGGGVYAGGTFTMSGGTVGDSSKTTPADGSSSSTYSNNAAYGGGIYAPLGSTLTLNGGYVSYNYASSDGGGIYAKGTSSFKANCNYNTAGANGGGILSSAISLTGGNIKGNKANNGGGLYAIGTISMSGGTVADNEATRYGGGINIESGTFTMTSGTIGDSGNKSNAAESTSGKHSNISGLGGGGICISGGTVILNGGTVGYNYCSGGGGGGICFKGGTLTVKNYVQYNTGYTAGGLSVQADGCTLDSATFTKNNASTNGGAAFISFGKTLNVKGNLSMPNPAEKSNDIFLQYYSTEGKYGWINVADSLGGSGIVAMITPTSYNAGKIVVKASSGVDLATQSQRFSLLPNTSDSNYNWLINTDGTLKQVIGTKLAPNAVGDIVYSDGSASPSSLSSLSNKQKNSAVAVIFSVSGTVKKGVGLTEDYGKKWANNTSYGSGATNETDGSNNMNYIKNQTNFQTKYPAFYWADTYTAPGFTSGWYIPAKDELTALMDQKDTVNSQITKIGGSATKFEPYVSSVDDPIPSHDYWTSTQFYSDTAYISGNYAANYQQIKTSESCYTRAIRKF
ncbi:MAG: hypothetical protein IKQ43_12390 [Treponema sp.]|nr:hypothetical protein [Treponema sp.]